MKVPLSWLKDYLNVNLAPAQIAKLFTSLGLEVDAITPINLDCTNVVVGKVTSAEKHPNADKLKIALVSDGLDLFQVVCGAPNCREGLVTAFAKLGSVLHDKDGKEFAVKAAKIRGVESSGMLCSPFELGLSDEHEGIIEFASHLKEGTDVASLYNDTIFDISLTPNLNHCGSIFGAARELSTIVEGQLTPPAVSVNENSLESTQEKGKGEWHLISTNRIPERYSRDHEWKAQQLSKGEVGSSRDVCLLLFTEKVRNGVSLFAPNPETQQINRVRTSEKIKWTNTWTSFDGIEISKCHSFVTVTFTPEGVRICSDREETNRDNRGYLIVWKEEPSKPRIRTTKFEVMTWG
jgi:tRNA-binding EMAP/Myf-like protein